MSSTDLRPRRAGRVPPRALPGAAALAVAVLLTVARPADGQVLPDAIPTWWHEAAGLTPLLTAPPPPVKPTICIIDTGVTPTPDLDISARWAYDGGTLDDVRATEDSPGHGTLVAHFAAAAVNGWGGAGAFPHARISSVRVFPPEGGASWQDYIRAITRCLKLDANTKVIVMALGGQSIDDGEAEELQHWIARARDRHDVNVVAAAGNGAGPPDFPGRFNPAFTTAALAADGSLCHLSARGPGVDIAVPGCGVQQADGAGRNWSFDGTSFAAAIAAGAIAAVRSYVAGLTAIAAETQLVAAARGAPPALDGGAALRAAGFPLTPGGGGASANPITTPTQVAAAPKLPRTGAHHAARPVRLGPPSLVIRTNGRTTLLLVRHRPRGAALECHIAQRHVLRQSSRILVRARRLVGRCRFVSAFGASNWINVRS
ncbi:MAG TPA: S8/S53 family peptidase [Solirubrobacteraceae bacterium]